MSLRKGENAALLTERAVLSVAVTDFGASG